MSSKDSLDSPGELDPPILQACRRNPISKKTIMEFLEKGHNVDQCSSSGLTPLHIACYKGNHGICNLLLQYKANVNARDRKYGYTPLHIAVKYPGDFRIVELLIKHSADINIEDKRSTICLHIACDRQLPDIVEMLLEADSSKVNFGHVGLFSPLASVCMNGNLEICKILLKHNADPNLVTGYLPLHFAVKDPDVFKLLLEVTDEKRIFDFYNHHPTFNSFSVYLLFFVDKTACFELFLQHFSLSDDYQLTSLTKEEIFAGERIMHLFVYSKTLETFVYALRFYLMIDVTEFAYLVCDQIYSENTFLRYVKFLYILFRMGVSAHEKIVEDMKPKLLSFINRFLKHAPNHNPKKAVAVELKRLLNTPCLSLKQLARSAFRKFVSFKVTHPWHCYKFVDDLLGVPQSVKNYIWYR